jgi:hypothetical protein
MNVAMLIAAAFSLFSNSTPLNNPRVPLAGDYVEARTASVFAGACHVNGELMTTGRDAVMAWQFNDGVRVMAAVSSEANLSDQSASRKSEIVVDDSSSKALGHRDLTAILARDGSSLGKIVSIQHAAITFSHEDREYKVESSGFAAMDVQGMPNDECCKQPNLVWYEPLVKLVGRKVGYTVDAEYSAGKVGDSWEREDENGAFYGAFVY